MIKFEDAIKHIDDREILSTNTVVPYDNKTH